MLETAKPEALGNGQGVVCRFLPDGEVAGAANGRKDQRQAAPLPARVPEFAAETHTRTRVLVSIQQAWGHQTDKGEVCSLLAAPVVSAVSSCLDDVLCEKFGVVDSQQEAQQKGTVNRIGSECHAVLLQGLHYGLPLLCGGVAKETDECLSPTETERHKEQAATMPDTKVSLLL